MATVRGGRQRGLQPLELKSWSVAAMQVPSMRHDTRRGSIVAWDGEIPGSALTAAREGRCYPNYMRRLAQASPNKVACCVRDLQ